MRLLAAASPFRGSEQAQGQPPLRWNTPDALWVICQRLAAQREEFFARAHGFGQILQLHGKGVGQEHGGLNKGHHRFGNGLRQVHQARRLM